MATLLDVTEMKSRETATRTTAKRYFQVRYDDPDVSAVTARDATGLPAYDAAHPDSSALTVDDRIPRRVDKSGLWVVEVTYKINDASLGGNDALAPLDRPTQDYTFTLGSVEDVDTDVNEAIIRNSAGQPVKVPMQHGDYGLRFVRNEASRDDSYAGYYFKTNSATFQGFAIGRVLCLGISQDYQEEVYRGSQVEYYRTTYNFAVAVPRFTGDTTYWQARFLDEGVMEKDGNNQVIPMRDLFAGQGFAVAALLDGAGAKLAANGAANWITKTIYGTADFAADFSL